MKQGRDIVSLAQEITRIASAKQDYVADTKAIKVESFEQGGVIHVGNEAFGIRPVAHGQIADHAEIPRKYYDRMVADAPALWANNVNHWFHTKSSRRMVRTLDGNMRAFLSDRYNRLDYDDVASAALPVLLESADIQIVSCEVTETRLYLKALFPKVQGEVLKGDVVQAGVVIQTSDVGLGSLAVIPMVYRLICTNGMVRADDAWRKAHIGALVTADENGVALRDETKLAQDKALMLTLQDTIRAASGEAFERLLTRMREATEGAKIDKPVPAIEILQKKLPILKSEGDSILERLIRNQDYTRYGVMNAITNLANDVKSYDRASELEVIGGRVLDLSANDWRQIAEAA